MVIFQLLSISVSLINENLHESVITGLKQTSWTDYVNTLENIIRLCYGDISIRNISFQYHISMQMLMK